MKKALCKTLLKHSNSNFLYLDEIVQVGKPYKTSLDWIIRIEIRTIIGEWYVHVDTQENAETLQKSIIKELKEYYGLDKQ